MSQKRAAGLVGKLVENLKSKEFREYLLRLAETVSCLWSLLRFWQITESLKLFHFCDLKFLRIWLDFVGIGIFVICKTGKGQYTISVGLINDFTFQHTFLGSSGELGHTNSSVSRS